MSEYNPKDATEIGRDLEAVYQAASAAMLSGSISHHAGMITDHQLAAICGSVRRAVAAYWLIDADPGPNVVSFPKQARA
jgi:hypothetical protein